MARSGVGAADLEDLVRAAEQAARRAPPPRTPNRPLVRPPSSSSADWDDVPAETSIAVFSDFAPGPRAGVPAGRGRGPAALRLRRARAAAPPFSGSSTGLRLRHDQPTGHVEVNAQSPDFARSAWAGWPRRTSPTSTCRPRRRAGERLRWAERPVDLPAGRYETLLPPSAVADLMIYAVLVGRPPATPTMGAPCSAGRAAARGSASDSPRCR